MLKTRVLTALTLGLLLVGIILAGSAWLFSVFMIVCIFAGAREWALLSGIHHQSAALIYAVLITMTMLYFHLFAAPGIQQLVVLAGAFWWCVAVIIIITYQRGRPVMAIPGAGKLVIGALVLLPAFIGLLLLSRGNASRELLLVFFLLIWLVDSAAYFSGRFFGRHRLASRVSPGKSMEGVVGSVLAAVVMAILYATFVTGQYSLVPILILFLLSTLFSVVGDLYESVMKREAGVKDSSRLLPGHGGVLDRIDSITAAAPVFVLGLTMLGGRP